jgi:hypothetical protein
MKKWFFVVALLTMAAMALPAYAAVYSCTGTVTSLEVASCCGGVVFVTGAGGLNTVAICTLNGSSGNFNADSCKAAYATLLAAKLTGQTVSINFSDNLTCSTQPGSTATSSAWAVTAQ